MKFEKTDVWGFEHAIRGMRQPKQSHNRSDSLFCYKNAYCNRICKNSSYGYGYHIGSKDLELMQTLIKAGSEHRKFLRQIMVSVDITAPIYWWKEFDTYKVGTVANSTSTMHKLASTPITMDCFETDNFKDVLIDNEDGIGRWSSDFWDVLIHELETLRNKYNKTKDKRYWEELIRLLPESWLQTRTVTMNYENVLNMYNQRCICPHKLNEWSGKGNPEVPNFKSWVESLPYAKELICIKKEK